MGNYTGFSYYWGAKCRLCPLCCESIWLKLKFKRKGKWLIIGAIKKFFAQLRRRKELKRQEEYLVAELRDDLEKMGIDDFINEAGDRA